MIFSALDEGQGTRVNSEQSQQRFSRCPKEEWIVGKIECARRRWAQDGMGRSNSLNSQFPEFTLDTECLSGNRAQVGVHLTGYG